jgi:hypothetical protein
MGLWNTVGRNVKKHTDFAHNIPEKRVLSWTTQGGKAPNSFGVLRQFQIHGGHGAIDGRP